MALSGSKNYTDTITAADIIALALRRLGELDASDVVDSIEQSDALLVLNLMVKEWTKLGLDNWLRQTGALWLTAPGTTSQFTLGPTGSRAAYNWYETTILGGGSSSSTSITISAADAVHCINGAYVGVRLDGGGISFATGTFVSTAITLSSGLTGTASAGNRVYIYAPTYQISRPSRLLFASRNTLDVTNTSVNSDNLIEMDSEIRIIGMDEYRTTAQKRQKGPPVSVYYEPTISNGTLQVWPTGNTTTKDNDKIYLTYNIYADDFDITSNNAQFPPEWMNTIAWNLASELATEYGLPLKEQQMLGMRAAQKLEMMLDYDLENASVIFERNYQPGVKP